MNIDKSAIYAPLDPFMRTVTVMVSLRLDLPGRQPFYLEGLKLVLDRLHYEQYKELGDLDQYLHFEAGGGFSFQAPEHPAHVAKQVKMGRRAQPGEFGQYIGNFSGVQDARDDMGVHWMNRDGIRECIPPAYTQWIGEQFLAQRKEVSDVGSAHHAAPRP